MLDPQSKLHEIKQRTVSHHPQHYLQLYVARCTTCTLLQYTVVLNLAWAQWKHKTKFVFSLYSLGACPFNSRYLLFRSSLKMMGFCSMPSMHQAASVGIGYKVGASSSAQFLSKRIPPFLCKFTWGMKSNKHDLCWVSPLLMGRHNFSLAPQLHIPGLLNRRLGLDNNIVRIVPLKLRR